MLLSLLDRLVIEGGVPIIIDNKIIGTIGVSGATSQQDGQIAEAGISTVNTNKSN